MGLGILCPGQGSQNPGMLEILADNETAGPVLSEAGRRLGRTLAELVSHPEDSHRNRLAQPLLCAAQVATWMALRDRLPTPRLFAGYSVGELAAYGCADALSPEELVALAEQRAVLMDTASETAGTLVTVRGLTRQQIESLCQEFGADVAIINGFDRYVIGLTAESVAEFRNAVAGLGGGSHTLPVGVAAHTHWMEPACRAFRTLLEDSNMRDPAIPVLSGVDALAVSKRSGAIDALSRQIANTIDWSACLEMLIEHGCNVLLELGPGTTLTRIVHDTFPDLAVRSVAEFRSLPAVALWVEKAGRRFTGNR